jgi:glutamine---fructose-6-phosphate transaminase (isomerizing)
MCGIFGISINNRVDLKRDTLRKYTESMFKLSESRGKEAAGCAVSTPTAVKIYKQPVSASTMIRSRQFLDFFNSATGAGSTAGHSSVMTPLSLIAHSRLVTNGAQEFHENNQPVVKNGLVGVHNGIIVNDHLLWSRFPQLRKQSDVDTEVLLGLLRFFYTDIGSLQAATRETFNQIQGSASIAVLFEDRDWLLLASNTGSLYICKNASNKVFLFASELYILQSFLDANRIESAFGKCTISQITAGRGLIVDTADLTAQDFVFNEADSASLGERPGRQVPRRITDTTEVKAGRRITPLATANRQAFKDIEAHYPVVEQRIDALQRCTRCILPESFPSITFDERGVCNYCNHYVKIERKGEDAPREIADRRRSQDGSLDCIVSLSGGRDSCFALHYVREELKLHPIAYSYDWGMITDLGRRNQARMCGKLGVEHILVSADINRKRSFIKKNIEAWLRKPDLGMIPLFMAGDKQYFYYANTLMKQYGINLLCMAENQLERVHFKHGFSGVQRYGTADEPAYNLRFSDKVNIAWYYGKQFLTNPSYLNASILDTICAYMSYYVIPHDYLYLFNYINWDEQEIFTLLRNEYDWELSPDTPSSWRIGDGTAAFYNYIYYTVAGFTEIDGFRSNQIREGMVTRDDALRLTKIENKPRLESLEWYAQTNGFDLCKAIKIIHAIPKRYAL